MRGIEKNFWPDFGQKSLKRWVDFDLCGLKIARLYWLGSY